MSATQSVFWDELDGVNRGYLSAYTSGLRRKGLKRASVEFYRNKKGR